MPRCIHGWIALSLLMGCGGEAGSSSGGNTICGDTASDPGNCGECGHVCAAAHAAPACVAGRCARGACSPGWYDIDGSPSNGCEAQCQGATCTVGTGPLARSMVFSAPPVSETGVVGAAFSSSGPAGDRMAFLPNHGVLGEATPLPWHDPGLPRAPFLSSWNSTVENLAGYDALLH